VIGPRTLIQTLTPFDAVFSRLAARFSSHNELGIGRHDVPPDIGNTGE
jgi:hypothetical protein